ncbi:unnamed protein product, partial [Gongylonema pulchrum]|uniref:Ubiquitin carboxyl-terminal hydrolase 36 n=1 Tax=Gongylonema pulchrum TaxID=637853 RepID=A0A183CZ02_9BILA
LGIFPAHIYGNQEDAHEFWTLLLAALDSAASNGMKNSGYNGSPKKNGEPRLTTRLEQMFYGKLRHENRCQSCAGFSVSHEQLQELNLAVQIDNHQGSIGLDDLLRAHFGNEVVNLDCAVCKQGTRCLRSTTICRPPFVLMIQLKRFTQGNKKNSTPISFQHQGETTHLGHYIAIVRGFDGKSWYFYSDHECYRVTEQTLLRREAYLLLYTRKEVAANTDMPALQNGPSPSKIRARSKLAQNSQQFLDDDYCLD